MATAKYQLREPSATAPTQVYLVFRFKNERLVYSVGVKVNPRFWNAEKQRVKNTSNVPDRDAVNNLLNDLETAAHRFYSEGMAAKNFSLADLKTHLEQYQGKAKAKASTFLEYVAAFIEAAPERTQPGTCKRLDTKTIAKYKTTHRVLTEFAAKYRRPLDFDTIDLDFYQEFTAYLHERSYKANTVGKYIQIIKTFLNDATLHGVNTNQAFKSRNFKVTKEDVENIYLNESELETLAKFDFTKQPYLDRVRDLFLVGCWTGLRFSDFTVIEPQKHVRDGFIHIEQKKTAGKVVIPIHPTVKAIFDKYGGRLPPAISNQKFNEYIKEVCRLAGFTQPITKGITQGGTRKILTLQKWEMVSSHTARRSFATNQFNSGADSYDIRQITGHRTDAAFARYIKATGEESARRLQLNWSKRDEAAKLKVV